MLKSNSRLGPLAGALALVVTSVAATPAILAQDATTPPAETAPAETAPAEVAPAPDVTPDTVVATVAGEPITEADVVFASEELAEQLQRIPREEQRAFLVSVLIDVKLMAAAARERGMADDDLFRQRVDYLEEQALRRQYITDVVAAEITPEALQARYEELAAEVAGEEELRARHILVETEEEAQALKTEIDGGADFAALANENSTDASAANGGDLGYFARGMMVEPFEQAAFALEEVGDVSDPVQSQFGWHLIKLEDRRAATPPPLEQIAANLQQQLFIEAYTNAIDALNEGVEIDIPDADLAARVAAQQGE
jgi:peptidyl-prolyl cis-trans isomerase C